MSQKKHRRPRSAPATGQNQRPDSPLRVIGGNFRGRIIAYHGDPGTRPMKDRTRQAVFNLLGPGVKGTHAIDLFAGTGALGLEALSRGATSATLIEMHFPTARLIEQNVATLQVSDRAEVVAADVFFWARRLPKLPTLPWVVFSSPPYDFYVERAEEMLRLITGLIDVAPADSLFVVESDERFDVAELPEADQWDVRFYRPAVIAIYQTPASR